MITQTTIDAIPGRASTFNNDVMRDVMQFHESNWSAAEVDIKKYKNCSSAYGAYKTAAKRMRVAVVPISRGVKLYLVRSGSREARVNDAEPQS